MIKIHEKDSILHRDIFEMLKLFYNDDEIAFISEDIGADIYVANEKMIVFGQLIEAVDRKNALFKALIKHNDYYPRFGRLTGIRPTNLGFGKMTLAQAREKYREKYLVKDDAIEFMIDIIKRESQILGSFDEKRFISMYISFPFCNNICKYCTFSKLNPGKELQQKYIEVLIDEIKDFMNVNKDKINDIKSIYIGGGSPGEMTDDQIIDLLQTLRPIIEKDSEITFEIGRPDSVSENKLRILKYAGVKRVCLNTQSTDQKTLDSVGRGHGVKEFYEAYDKIKSMDTFDINTDLIFGFENESNEVMKKSLEDIFKLDPDNISIHPLAIKKKRDINIKKRNIQDTIFWYNIIDMLSENAYQPYYMYRQKSCWNNFESVGYAKEGKECLYNIAITEGYGDIVGFGLGASSCIDGKRTVATKEIGKYLNRNLGA